MQGKNATKTLICMTDQKPLFRFIVIQNVSQVNTVHIRLEAGSRSFPGTGTGQSIPQDQLVEKEWTRSRE